MHPTMEGVSLGGVVAKPAPGKKLICWEQRWPQMPKPLAGWLRFSLKRLKKKGFFGQNHLGGEGKNVGNPLPLLPYFVCALVALGERVLGGAGVSGRVAGKGTVPLGILPGFDSRGEVQRRWKGVLGSDFGFSDFLV